MKRLLSGWPAWAIAAACAVLAGFVTYVQTSGNAIEESLRVGPVTNDRALQAAEGLRQDLGSQSSGNGVYVAPQARDLLSDQQVKGLRREMRKAPVPIMFVAWDASPETGLYIYGHDEVAIALDRPAVYVLWAGPGHFQADGIGTLPGYGTGVSSTGDPVARMRDLVVALRAQGEAMGSRRDFIDDVAGPGDDSEYWGGPGPATFLGALFGAAIGLLGMLVVALLGAWWRSAQLSRLRSRP